MTCLSYNAIFKVYKVTRVKINCVWLPFVSIHHVLLWIYLTLSWMRLFIGNIVCIVINIPNTF